MPELGESQKQYLERNRRRKSRNVMAKELGVSVQTVSRWLDSPDSHRTLKRPWYPRWLVDPFSRFGPERQAQIQIGALFLLAFLLRLFYLYQAHGTPFWSPITGGYDDTIFDQWARGIVQGNWLGDPIQYIYRMPLYGYFLAIFYGIFGASYTAVYLFQAALGAATCVLAYLIGRRLFTPSTGWLAGLFCAFSGPSIFYGAMLLGETLAALLLTASFYFLLRYLDARKPAWLAAGGAGLGLCALLRANALITAPLALGWILWSNRRSGLKKVFLQAALFTLPLCLVILPITLRNYIVSKDFVLISAHGGMNFYVGNAPEATGSYCKIPGISTNPEDMHIQAVSRVETALGRKPLPSEVSAWWYSETFRRMGAEGPGYLFPLYARKILIYCNHYEQPDVWDYQFVSEEIPLLMLPLPGFGILLALALPGMILLRRRINHAPLLYLFTIGYAASILVFFVSGRYRIPIIPLMAVFAAAFLVSLPEHFQAGVRRGLLTVSSLLIGFTLAYLPIPHSSFAYTLNSVGVAYKRAGKVDQAIRVYKEAIQDRPDYATPYFNLGIAFEAKGEMEKAARCFAEAVQLDPNYQKAKVRLWQIRAFLDPTIPLPWLP